MAEMEAKGLKMSPELLQTDQLIHLRLCHASCLVENLQTEVKQTVITLQWYFFLHISRNLDTVSDHAAF